MFIVDCNRVSWLPMMPAPSRMMKFRTLFKIVPNTYLLKPLPLIKAPFTQVRIETVRTICFMWSYMLKIKFLIIISSTYLPTHVHTCVHTCIAHTHPYFTPKLSPSPILEVWHTRKKYDYVICYSEGTDSLKRSLTFGFLLSFLFLLFNRQEIPIVKDRSFLPTN